MNEIVPVQLKETTYCEGNILEYPLFRLSNRELKPKHADGRIDPNDYVSELTFSRKGPGKLVTTCQVILRASPHHGYPGMFAFLILLTAMRKAQFQGFKSQKVPLTRAEICKELGMKSYGGRQFKLIDNALESLKNYEIAFHDSWRDGRSSSHHPGIRLEHLVKNFRFRPAGKPSEKQLLFNFDEFIELGDGLWEGLQTEYKILVDFDYITRLPTDTARRLYDYLTKKDGKEGSSRYEEGLQSLAKKLPLSKTSPYHVRETLEPALEALKTPRDPDGKRFLSHYEFQGSRSETKLVVQFASEEGIRDRVRRLTGTLAGQGFTELPQKGTMRVPPTPA